MTISAKTSKILWANAAGQCSFSHCRKKLCTDQRSNALPHTLGQMAHIKGEKEGANRFDGSQTDDERNSYLNLILLCAHDHTIIDQKENEDIYSVQILHEIKKIHEDYIDGRLGEAVYGDKFELAKTIRPLIEENHEIFMNYGPHSDAARKNPQSDAHSIWVLERISTIVPNNRRLAKITESNRDLFAPEEQNILAKFLVHARSYERWVADEVTYESVVRFPQEFNEMIKSLTNAGA